MDLGIIIIGRSALFAETGAMLNMTKFETTRFIIYLIFLVGLTTGINVGIILAERFDSNYELKTSYSESIIEEKCGLTLEDTAYCLKNELKTFYNYNSSNIGKELTLTELREQGGVCSHYSAWYVQNMEKYGYKSEKLVFDMNLNKTKKHAIAVSSDDTGYCVLDQLSINCVRYAVA